MTELQIRLLGKPQISRGDDLITDFGTAKIEALFYFLAVTQRAHTRETLAELLWGDMPDTKAKRNLSKALSILRKVVGPEHLIIDRQSAAINQDASYWLDVTQFQTIIEESDPAEAMETLRQAVEWYRGDFLEGLTIRDAVSFEEWMLNEREHLRELMLRALDTLVTHYTEQGRYETGIDYANRLLDLDPWRESAHRQLMALLARSGQRNAALAQYDTCRQVLAEAFGVEPTTETTAIYERLKATDEPPPHNLPSQPNTFVGRTAELHQMTTLLDNPNCRLLTIIGPGGVGKTRLALEGASRYLTPEKMVQSPGFPDGLYFVSLAPPAESSAPVQRPPDQMTQILVASIATTLGYSLKETLPPTQQIIEYLRQDKARILLILDSFERLIEGANFLDTLLQTIPTFKVLVTSRERLNLMQEWVLELDGLDYPKRDWRLQSGDWSEDRLAELRNYSAITLFLQQAQKVQPGFDLSETDVSQIIRICQLVEGMPLALELAASWLRLSNSAEIAAEIEKNLDFLATSYRNVPAQHRSLRAVFEHSWQLLSPPEQAVFRQLSVFRGGFQPEAAQVVVEASLMMLGGLVDKSLIRRTTAGRYEIHELLRQYAAEKLETETDEYEAVRDRHAQYYAEFLKQRSKNPQQNDNAGSLAELSAEADNIRWGWQRIIEAGQLEDVTQYWYLGSLEQVDDPARSDPTALRPPDPSWDRGLALHTQGFTAYQQGQYERAKQCLHESLAISQAMDDALYIARSKTVLGLTTYALGDYAEARGWLQQSLSELRAVGEYRYRGYALAYLGRIALDLGQPLPEQIETALHNSLLISRQVGDQQAVIHILKNWGGLRARLATTTEALTESQTLLEECVTLCRNVGAAWCMTIALTDLGRTQAALNEPQAAGESLEEALQLALSTQFTPLALEVLIELAGLQVIQAPASAATQEKILPLVTFVLNHAAGSRQTKDNAARLLAELEKAGLSPALVKAAQKRQPVMSLDRVVKEMQAL